MALDTYTNLQASILSWAHRTGDATLTAMLPDFITLCEARISRDLKPIGGEFEVELAMVPNSRYVAVPALFQYPINLWLKAWLPRQQLTWLLPEQMPAYTNVPSYPQYWAIDGKNIAFDVPAQSAFPFDFRYAGDLVLSDANPTNYTFSRYPDLYLWGSLVELCTFTEEDARISLFEQRYQEALKDSKSQENANRRAPLVTDLAGVLPSRRFNINRGY